MKKEHSSSRNFQFPRTVAAMALNLLLILGPIVSVSSVARAEDPKPLPAAEEVAEAPQPAADVAPEPQQAADEAPEPQQTGEIDAAFYHPGEKVSYFFQGDHYYRLTETKVDNGFPKKLPGDFKGLPASFHSGIDAAVIDPSSGNLYFFKGNKYSAFKTDTKTAYPGYSEVTLPGGWRGLPAEFSNNLDAAIDEDGAVVFIKGNRRAIVKNESLVRVEDFSASDLTGAGMVNAAFKYSNGRNYFFSGDMFSRAIAFTKEPRQLNPIAGSWVGVKPASSFEPIDPNATKVTQVLTIDPQAPGNPKPAYIYVQVGYRAWEHRKGDHTASTLVTNCTEVSRGANTINLSCANGSYQLELALNINNVRRFENGRHVAIKDQAIRETDTFEVIADADLKDPFRPGDILKIMAWISKETSNSKLDYCYKNTFGRGVGTPLTNCPAGTEKNGALCYPNCRTGFAGNGPVCWGVCPQGFTDIGAFCQKTGQYEREGFAWQIGDPLLPNYSGPIGRCEGKYGRGACEQRGAMIYPKCRAGFKETVVTVCAPVCPAGWADTGTGCTKPSYGRGAGQPMTCAPGLQEQAGLCYQNCSAGYQGVGPICWQQCKGDQSTECGVGCASSADSCASATADMVLAPINLLSGLVTMGISAKAKAAVDAAAKAGKTGASAAAGGLAELALDGTPKWTKLLDELKELDALGGIEKLTSTTGLALDLSNVGQGLRDEIEKWTDEYEANFAQNTTLAVESRIRSEFDYNTARYIKRYYALHHLGSILEADGWRIGKLVMTIGAVVVGVIGDPGFLATINAFAQPMCPPVGGTPFPRVVRIDRGTPISPSGSRWEQVAGGPVQVSVANDGTTWGVTGDDNIVQWSGGRWGGVPGKLKQISVGSLYFVFGVNSAGQVFSRDQNGWARLSAPPMKQVSVGNDGKLWGIDTADNIYRWDVPDNNILRVGGGSPTLVPGKLKQISVGNAANVWGVNAGNQIYRWTGSTWTNVPGILKQVSVGSDGSVWGVNPGNEIFRWTGNSWEKIPGGLSSISVADSGLVWGVNLNNQIFSRVF
ncbi:MAG: hypothetical protein IPM63_13700 [Acidobacteriota bacterium]|nr:MAG: hypothetical protein IPM63_13700 [Acidobacteriota bacterium]